MKMKINDDDILERARGDSLILGGENVKASFYVKHAGELGYLRERMVGSFVRANTPEKYRVETGFIHDGEFASPQIDLLVHNCHEVPPLYRWEDFVVAQQAAAKAAIEVKSAVDSQRDCEGLLNWHAGVARLGPPFMVPTFAYALAGATFASIVEWFASAVRTNVLELPSERRARNVPVCFVAQDRHYVFVRPHFGVNKPGGEDKIEDAICCMDFSRHKQFCKGDLPAIETACFTQFYKHVLIENHGPYVVYLWFDCQQTEPNGKCWIDSNGEIRTNSMFDSLVGG